MLKLGIKKWWVLKSVTTLDNPKGLVKEKVLTRNFDVKDNEESKVWRSKQGRAADGVIYRDRSTLSRARLGLD